MGLGRFFHASGKKEVKIRFYLTVVRLERRKGWQEMQKAARTDRLDVLLRGKGL